MLATVSVVWVGRAQGGPDQGPNADQGLCSHKDGGLRVGRFSPVARREKDEGGPEGGDDADSADVQHGLVQLRHVLGRVDRHHSGKRG